jgi:hypothetical protein
MIEKFGLWTYNDGWQVLLLVCVMLIAAGILMGILWNTKGLADELSGRKRQRELEYLRHRFAEMNVRSLDEVNVADPLSHVGESAPLPLTPAGVFAPQAAQHPLGTGEVLNVGGVEVSQQQVAAIKSELLGDDDEPATGYFADKEAEKQKAQDDAEAEVEKQEAQDDAEAKAEVKADAEVKANAEESISDTNKTGIKSATYVDATDVQQGIRPTSVESLAAQGIKPAGDDNKTAHTADAKDSDFVPTNTALLRIRANAEKAFGSGDEQATGVLSPEEDDASDSTPTGIFTPDQKDEPQTAKPAEAAGNGSSEGITSHLAPETDDEAGVTTTFAPVGSRSAYHMEGAQFMGELISTGSYDPKTGTTKLDAPSGVDKATTGFLND